MSSNISTNGSVKSFQTISETQMLVMSEIQTEYERGFLALNSLPNDTVTFYGGSRIEEGHATFQDTEEIAFEFAKRGWGVVSGGGPGAMTASLRGAQKAGGKAVSFRINLSAEPPFVGSDFDLLFEHFSVRKHMLRQSDVFIYVPGGIGTLDELMENLTLISTKKHPKKPIFLLDSSFWNGYLEWLEKMLYNERKTVTPELLSLCKVVDTPKQVIEELFGKE